jgi:hypothetical protein
MSVDCIKAACCLAYSLRHAAQSIAGRGSSPYGGLAVTRGQSSVRQVQKLLNLIGESLPFGWPQTTHVNSAPMTLPYNLKSKHVEIERAFTIEFHLVWGLSPLFRIERDTSFDCAFPLHLDQ